MKVRAIRVTEDGESRDDKDNKYAEIRVWQEAGDCGAFINGCYVINLTHLINVGCIWDVEKVKFLLGDPQLSKSANTVKILQIKSEHWENVQFEAASFRSAWKLTKWRK